MTTPPDSPDKLSRRAIAGIAEVAGVVSTILTFAKTSRPADQDRSVVNLPIWWTNLRFKTRIDMAARCDFTQAEIWRNGNSEDKALLALHKHTTAVGLAKRISTAFRIGKSLDQPHD